MNFRLKQGLITHTVGSNLVLYNSESGFLYTLNNTAADVVNYITESKSVKEIRNLMSLNYGIEKNIIKKDVYAIIKKLKKDSLIS